MTGKQKALWVNKALRFYLEDNEPDEYTETDAKEVSDFLCGLMHLCAARGWKFVDLANDGRRHFRYEFLEEQRKKELPNA